MFPPGLNRADISQDRTIPLSCQFLCFAHLRVSPSLTGEAARSGKNTTRTVFDKQSGRCSNRDVALHLPTTCVDESSSHVGESCAIFFRGKPPVSSVVSLSFCRIFLLFRVLFRYIVVMFIVDLRRSSATGKPPKQAHLRALLHDRALHCLCGSQQDMCLGRMPVSSTRRFFFAGSCPEFGVSANIL